MSKERQRIKSRKTAKKSLEWQLAEAEDLHFKLIHILVKLEEIPDTLLPQAPLARATISYISDSFRKWKEGLQVEIAKKNVEDAEKK